MSTSTLCIKPLRNTLGISAAELARRVGVTRQCIYTWEHGVWPQAQLLPAIASALECSIDDLYKEVDDDDITRDG